MSGNSAHIMRHVAGNLNKKNKYNTSIFTFSRHLLEKARSPQKKPIQQSYATFIISSKISILCSFWSANGEQLEPIFKVIKFVHVGQN